MAAPSVWSLTNLCEITGKVVRNGPPTASPPPSQGNYKAKISKSAVKCVSQGEFLAKSCFPEVLNPCDKCRYRVKRGCAPGPALSRQGGCGGKSLVLLVAPVPRQGGLHHRKPLRPRRDGPRGEPAPGSLAAVGLNEMGETRTRKLLLVWLGPDEDKIKENLWTTPQHLLSTIS